MPNRMIREGLLESEAVLSLPVEARWLYVSILLSADDIGLFEATPFRLARRADVRREHADKLLTFLADSDLVRLYEVAGKRYGFIPKFGQRLQIKRIKHAEPPDALLLDEVETLNKIKHLASKTTVDHGCATATQQRVTTAQPPEPEPEPEEKKKTTRAPKAPAAVPSGFAEFWRQWPNTARKSNKKGCLNVWTRNKFEDRAQEIISHVETMKKSKPWKEGFEPAPLTYLNQERWADGVSGASVQDRSFAGVI